MMLRVFIFAALLVAIYGVTPETCTDYENYYWDDHSVDGVTTYCRMVYCSKEGIVTEYRPDQEASSPTIKDQCGTSCDWGDWEDLSVCGCPSCTTPTADTCDYGSGTNMYWEETTDTDGVTTYCRLVYCVKVTDEAGNAYGAVEALWRPDEATSEYKMQSKCGLSCSFADFQMANTCGCPSCKCDDYGSDSNMYWEEATDTDGVSTYCRLVYCVKATDEAGNPYGIIQNQWRPDQETSETKMQSKCGLSCNFADFEMADVCGCPSCRCVDFVCPDGVKTISGNAECAYNKDECCVVKCEDGTAITGTYTTVTTEGLAAEYCEYNGETCSSIGCTDDTYTCIDKTILPARSDDDCKFPCPDIGCDTKICCDGQFYETECLAQRECEGISSSYAVSDIVCDVVQFECPDGTFISADDCCNYDTDKCCVQACEDGTQITGTYSSDGTTAKCDYNGKTCTRVGCMDDTYICIDQTELPARSDVDCKFPCPDIGCDTKVCCDGQLYETECLAQQECDGTITASQEISCTSVQFECPDKTLISSDECCTYDKDKCCVETCEDGTVINGAYTISSDGKIAAKCDYNGETCTSVGCTDDVHECSDSTTLTSRLVDQDCDFDCSAEGCDTIVCCDGEPMEECEAVNDCDSDAGFEEQPDACTEDAFVCSDGETAIGRNECCVFDKDDCCIQTCSNGDILQGVYYENAECKYDSECEANDGCTDDVHECSDGTTLVRSVDKDCDFDCSADGCDTIVCCDGKPMKECEAVNGCEDEGGFTDAPDMCTADALTCPDGTTVGRNECCEFDCEGFPGGSANGYGIMIGIVFVMAASVWM